MKKEILVLFAVFLVSMLCINSMALGSDEKDNHGIEITKAAWQADRESLVVRAEEGRGSATLTVTYNGQDYTMSYNANKRRYELILKPICYAEKITISSTSGASCSGPVSVRGDVSVAGFACTDDDGCVDADNDGYPAVACGGNDCDDNNSAINPGAMEICGDGIDQDCSGADLPCGTAHDHINEYLGPKTCLACHPIAGDDVVHSIHGTWSGATPDVPNISGESGKWNQINTYCTAPAPADFACRSCHATTGKVDNLTDEDMDCLVCHQDAYQRSLSPLADPVTVTDWTGTERIYNFPRRNDNGEYEMAPRFDLMPEGTTMVELARTVHRPTRQSCLRCHAKAGGGDGTKRGDISTANIAPARTSDVHMSPDGGNLTCQACHVTQNHLIPGRGMDLRPTEGDTIGCTDCHAANPHTNATYNRHTNRIACQTCHIPVYGKDSGTELHRDWRSPHWNPGGCQGQGAWVGHEVRASNVVPDYAWFNGTSYVYDWSQSLDPDPDGYYVMSRPLGDLSDPAAKIYPVKIHTAVQPRDDDSGRMSFDVLKMFMTGDYEAAARSGMDFIGETGSYSWVNTLAYQLITHGVEPKENALTCENCHAGSNGLSTNTRMPFAELGYHELRAPDSSLCSLCHSSKTDSREGIHDRHVRTLGYACTDCHGGGAPLKESQATLCDNCHGNKNENDVQKIHEKHVTDKGYDCSTCHTF